MFCEAKVMQLSSLIRKRKIESSYVFLLIDTWGLAKNGASLQARLETRYEIEAEGNRLG